MKKGGAALYHLEPETPQDLWEVEELFDTCFGAGRKGLSSYRLRLEGQMIASLSLVARVRGGALAGAIRYWPVLVGGRAALLLGPLAVHPTRQGEGLGGQLIAESLAQGRALGWERVLLMGDAPYYRRFGFRKLEGVRMPPPSNPERILGYALGGAGWHGVRGKVVAWQRGLAVPKG